MPETRTRNGSVAEDVSRGAVQLLRKYTGRGHTKARRVEAFFSDDQIDPDYAVEFFLLQPLPDGESQAIAGEAEPPAW